MYPERKPLYDCYKKLLQAIVEEQSYPEYAEGEIDALDQELMNAFKEIRQAALLRKWPHE